MRRLSGALRPAVMLAMLVLAALSAGAQDRGTPTTVLTVVASAGGADPALGPVMLNAVRLQLVRRRLAFTTGDAGETPTNRSVVTLATESGAAYGLLVSYGTSDTQVELKLELYDAADGAFVGSATARGRIDLVLDAMVAQLMEQLLAGRSLHPDPAKPEQVARAAPGGSAAEEAAPPAERTEPTAESAEPTAEPTEPVQAPDQAASEAAQAETEEAPPAQAPAAPAAPEAAASRAEIPQPAQRWRYIGVSIGAAPLVMVGPARDFAEIGVLGTAEVHLRIRAGAGVLGVGLQSGFGWFRAEGAVATADISLVPIGVDVRYAPTESSRIGLSLHLSGGPAILRASTAAGTAVVGVVPYALAGMAMDVRLAAFLGLRVEASFVAFFEDSLLIAAFSPGLSLQLRI